MSFRVKPPVLPGGTLDHCRTFSAIMIVGASVMVEVITSITAAPC
jgi:hypothetical protein